MTFKDILVFLGGIAGIVVFSFFPAIILISWFFLAIWFLKITYFPSEKQIKEMEKINYKY